MLIPFLSLKSITDKYSEEINAAVLRVVNSGWYLQGNENKSFEENYAKYEGTIKPKRISLKVFYLNEKNGNEKVEDQVDNVLIL